MNDLWVHSKTCDRCNNWSYLTKVRAAKALGQIGDKQATLHLLSFSSSGIHFDKDVVRQFAELNAEIDIDLYVLADEED